jgi:hypothetical protein
LFHFVGVAEGTAFVQPEELAMYIGIGTIVLIAIIVLLILALRRR